MKAISIFITYAFVISCAVAQSADPFISDLKGFYTVRKGDLTKAVDRMPAEDYNFRPVPGVRSFAELVGHIVDAQMGFCSSVKGAPRRLNAGAMTTKAELVAALKASFDECDSAMEAMSDVKASESVKSGNAAHTRFWSLLYATLHDNEEYGYLSMYLRLKGLVPPSTDSR